MSGGGGTGTEPVGPTRETPCPSLVFTTTLTSPEPDVLPTLAVGTELTLELRTAGERNVVAVLTAGGEVAGAITERLADLLRCLQDGFDYVAEVTAIEGAWVDLRVRAA